MKLKLILKNALIKLKKWKHKKNNEKYLFFYL